MYVFYFVYRSHPHAILTLWVLDRRMPTKYIRYLSTLGVNIYAGRPNQLNTEVRVRSLDRLCGYRMSRKLEDNAGGPLVTCETCDMFGQSQARTQIMTAGVHNRASLDCPTHRTQSPATLGLPSL